MINLSALTGRVLVTGSNGCLGSHVISALVTRAGIALSRIHALSLHGPKPEPRVDGVTYHQADTSDAQAVSAVISKVQPELIVHTAGVNAFAGDASTFTRVNVTGTKNVLHAAQQAGTKAFVHTSSAIIVKDGHSDVKYVDESQPVLDIKRLNNPYKWSKALAEDMVLSANREALMLTISLRVSGLFGPRETIGAQPQIEAARDGKLRYQIGDDSSKTTQVYVENAADCHILAGQALLQAYDQPQAADDKRVDGEAFFLAGDGPIGFWELSRKLGSAAGFHTDPNSITVIPKSLALGCASVVDFLVWISSLGRKKGELREALGYTCRWRTYSIDKARARLGYAPAVSLEEAIRRTGEAYVAQVAATKSS